MLVLIGTAALRCNWRPLATTLLRPPLAAILEIRALASYRLDANDSTALELTAYGYSFVAIMTLLQRVHSLDLIVCAFSPLWKRVMMTSALPQWATSSKAVQSFVLRRQQGAYGSCQEGDNHVRVVVHGCQLERRAAVLI